MNSPHLQGDIDFIHRVACVILAGGQGTRLFPLTKTRCKPAVSFGGKYCLIDIPLSHALNAYIPSIFIVSQYLIGSLHRHVLEAYSQDRMRDSRIHLLSPEQTTTSPPTLYQGTADAIRKNLSYLQESPADYFLILSGDQLYNMDLHQVLLFAQKENADLVIAALPVEEREARRMGLLRVDPTCTVTNFFEKPTDPQILQQFTMPEETVRTYAVKNPLAPHYLGSMGIYVFKREALFSLLERKGDDFGKDLIPVHCKTGKTKAFIYNGYWEDIGTIQAFYEANMALIDQKNCLNMYDEKNPIFAYPHHLPSPIIRGTNVNHSLIAEGSVIDAKEIDHSVIGFRSCIQAGTVIHHSVVMGNHYYSAPHHQTPRLPHRFTIGKHCTIKKAILDEHCSIGDHVQLINKQNLTDYDGNGIFIRDKIIIVTSGTKIPDHFIL